jgi:hypothetical protein
MSSQRRGSDNASLKFINEVSILRGEDLEGVSRGEREFDPTHVLDEG